MPILGILHRADRREAPLGAYGPPQFPVSPPGLPSPSVSQQYGVPISKYGPPKVDYGPPPQAQSHQAFSHQSISHGHGHGHGDLLGGSFFEQLKQTLGLGGGHGGHTQYGPPPKPRGAYGAPAKQIFSHQSHGQLYGPPPAPPSLSYGPPSHKISNSFGPPPAGRPHSSYGPPNHKPSASYGKLQIENESF